MLTYSPLFVYKQERIIVFSEWANGETKSFIRTDSNMIMKMSSVCNSSICIWLGTDHLTCRVGDYNFYFSFRIFFLDNTSSNIFFFLSHKAQFFPPEINIRLYDKNSESIFFFLHQNQNIFSATLGIRIFFLEKGFHITKFYFKPCDGTRMLLYMPIHERCKTGI